MTGRSLVLPIMMETKGDIIVYSLEFRVVGSLECRVVSACKGTGFLGHDQKKAAKNTLSLFISHGWRLKRVIVTVLN
jgi:hypothetical protein